LSAGLWGLRPVPVPDVVVAAAAVVEKGVSSSTSASRRLASPARVAAGTATIAMGSTMYRQDAPADAEEEKEEEKEPAPLK
jgi:hypothetical protein